MSGITRRNMVRQATGAGLGVLVGSEVRGQEPTRPSAMERDDPNQDPMFRLSGMMFAEQVSFPTDPNVMEFRITSAIGDPTTGKNLALIRLATASVTRLNVEADDFTRQGGVYWRCGKAEGKFQFKAPAGTMLVVRDGDGTVTCYSLAFDLRC